MKGPGSSVGAHLAPLHSARHHQRRAGEDGLESALGERGYRAGRPDRHFLLLLLLLLLVEAKALAADGGEGFRPSAAGCEWSGVDEQGGGPVAGESSCRKWVSCLRLVS